MINEELSQSAQNLTQNPQTIIFSNYIGKRLILVAEQQQE